MPRKVKNDPGEIPKRKNFFEDFGVKSKKPKNDESSEEWVDVDNGELLIYNKCGIEGSEKVCVYFRLTLMFLCSVKFAVIFLSLFR